MPQVQERTTTVAARERIVLENASGTLFTPRRAYPNLASTPSQHKRATIGPLLRQALLDRNPSCKAGQRGPMRSSNLGNLILFTPIEQHIKRANLL
jgi:hypothetical protein